MKKPKPSELGKKAEKALQEAVAKAIEEHRRRGLPIAVEEDKKSVWVYLDKKK